jgi:hypothetical protein
VGGAAGADAEDEQPELCRRLAIDDKPKPRSKPRELVLRLQLCVPERFAQRLSLRLSRLQLLAQCLSFLCRRLQAPLKSGNVPIRVLQRFAQLLSLLCRRL